MPEYKEELGDRVECDANGIKWNVKNYGDGVGISFAEENRAFEIIEVPEQLGNKSVLALLEKAFYQNNFLKEIKIPNTVTEIGEEAFFHCDFLRKVTISENIKEIPKWCFSYCKKLEEINGLDHILSFASYSFYMALAVSELVLNQEIKYIGYYAFSECEVERLYLGNIVQAGKMSFARCNYLKEVYFSEDARAVPAYCFFGCKNLKYLSLSFVTAIGDAAFGRCESLKKLKLPAGLMKTGREILLENQMESVVVPEKYENITYGERAAEYIVYPTVSVSFDYNETYREREIRTIYYGETISPLPLSETICKEMIGWYENPTQERLSKELLELLILKYGTWIKDIYETTLQPYDFEKPIYSDITLYAQWRIKGGRKLYEAKKLCD